MAVLIQASWSEFAVKGVGVRTFVCTGTARVDHQLIEWPVHLPYVHSAIFTWHGFISSNSECICINLVGYEQMIDRHASGRLRILVSQSRAISNTQLLRVERMSACNFGFWMRLILQQIITRLTCLLLLMAQFESLEGLRMQIRELFQVSMQPTAYMQPTLT